MENFKNQMSFNQTSKIESIILERLKFHFCNQFNCVPDNTYLNFEFLDKSCNNQIIKFRKDFIGKKTEKEIDVEIDFFEPKNLWNYIKLNFLQKFFGGKLIKVSYKKITKTKTVRLDCTMIFPEIESIKDKFEILYLVQEK